MSASRFAAVCVRSHHFPRFSPRTYSAPVRSKTAFGTQTAIRLGGGSISGFTPGVFVDGGPAPR